ncbi:MAG: hypothetical protein KAR19_05250 [Bacteroidales bacterium]|nr:hypothetical protein [Bacteroidales bacterium]
MRTTVNKSGKEEIIFLSQTDKDILIYMSSDVWITPELKKFKNEILERLEESDPAN